MKCPNCGKEFLDNEIIREAARINGSKTSPKKKLSSKANGSKKGKKHKETLNTWADLITLLRMLKLYSEMNVVRNVKRNILKGVLIVNKLNRKTNLHTKEGRKCHF